MQWISNFLAEYSSLISQGILETLYMVFMSAVLAYVIGLPVGILLHITAKNGIRRNDAVNSVVGWIVNIGRSIPFIILMMALIPFTRFIVGSSIGPTGATVSLVIAAAPFVARLVEGSLAEVDNGVIEAAQSMGATDWQIITRVMLVEAIPSLVRGAAVTIITLVGYSAMAGACGAGGLGDIAIRYGYQRYQPDVMYVILVLIIILVQIIQTAFNITVKKIDKKNK